MLAAVHCVSNHMTICRFHNAAEEIVVGRDIVPPISDGVRLTIDEYRNKLYEVLLVYVQFIVCFVTFSNIYLTSELCVCFLPLPESVMYKLC